MTEKTTRLLMLGCIAALMITLFISQRSHSQLICAVLDDMIADCKAGSLANYCKPAQREMSKIKDPARCALLLGSDCILFY